MHKIKYVFAQLVSFLDNDKFRRIVDKYKGNHYAKSFTCWNQLPVLMFGQLFARISLRDLILAVQAHQGKSYHLGFGNSVTRSNLAKANQNRDYRIFEEFAYYMIEIARKKCINSAFKLNGNVYSFDSTTMTSVWKSFGGLSSASIKEVSKYILFMTLRLKFQRYFISQLHLSTI